MVKHQKTLLRTDRLPEAPWEVGCTCGWQSRATDEKHAGKLHTAHRKVSKASYRLTRKLGGGVIFVRVVPPINGDWGYTMNPNDALVVDEKTRTRFLRHMRVAGLKGGSLLVPAQG